MLHKIDTKAHRRLVIFETHPVQYHAPVYRCLAQEFGVDVTVVYGSDFSVQGYRDAEFGASFAWDTDLLGGVENRFLSHKAKGGAADYHDVSAIGMDGLLAELAPDAVMALGYSHPFDRAALNWARRHRIPLLFRGETSDLSKPRSWLKSLVRDLILRRLYFSCGALLYVGQRSRAHYERLGVPDSKLFFSPYCVDDSTFRCSMADRADMREATRQQLDIQPDAIVILFSGKLSWRKGVDLIPEAVRLLPAELRARIHLLFLGDGKLRGTMADVCAKNPSIRASFAGFQNQSSLSAYYHAADLLTLPSRAHETWGLVVNEALLHGLPCVVSESVGSQPDLVIPGRTGACCRSDEAPALAKALTSVILQLQSPDLAAGCKSLVAGYSKKAAAEGVTAALDNLFVTRR